MNNASDNAAELKRSLTLVMNRKRQAKITTELTVSAAVCPALLCVVVPWACLAYPPQKEECKRRPHTVQCTCWVSARARQATAQIRSHHAPCLPCQATWQLLTVPPVLLAFRCAGDCGGRLQRVSGTMFEPFRSSPAFLAPPDAHSLRPAVLLAGCAAWGGAAAAAPPAPSCADVGSRFFPHVSAAPS